MRGTRSTKQVLGTSANGQSRDLLQSGPGKPCAVFLTESADFFGHHGIWCIGYKMKETSKNATSVRLLDQSEEDDVPLDNIQLLDKVEATSESLQDQSRYTCNALSVVENPDELKSGDLVYGQFQKGLLLEVSSVPEVFFRGRVAGVCPINKTCDICYDDGDYEMSVPFSSVVLVTANHNETHWIDGIKIAKKAKCKVTGALATEAILTIDDEHKVRYNYSVGDVKWNTKVSYKTAVQFIFNDAIEKIDPTRRLHWPQNEPLPQKRLAAKQSEKRIKKARKSTTLGRPRTTNQGDASDSMEMDVENKSDEIPKYLTPAARRPKTKKLPVYAEASDELVDDDVVMNEQDSEYSGEKLKKTSTTTGISRRSQRLTASKPQQNTIRPRCDVSAVPEALCAIQNLEPLPEYAITLVPMSRMEASTLEKVWHHEPFAGQELLLMNFACRGRKPSKEFWVEVVNLITFGPQHEGVFFPDSYRMELTTDYVLKVFRTKGILQDCCDALTDEYRDDNGFGDIVLNRMIQNYYMAPDDLDRETATDRIFNTVQAKCCSSRVFHEILRHILHQSVVDDREPTLLRGLFLQTPKECFRKAILVAQSIWKLAPRSFGIEFNQLAESWGCILSYFAWWYGKCANEDADALADLLSDIQVSVDKCVLFDVIDSLRSEIVPQVRPKLADRWGLSEVYNLCYS